jgi:hypothetical protein
MQRFEGATMRASTKVMLLASVLALAACGGGTRQQPGAGGATTATAAPSTTAAASTTTTGVSIAADKATARALLLRLSDLPGGWRATPYRQDLVDKAINQQLAACLGRPSPETYTTVDLFSPDFSMGNAGVSSEAQLVKTADDFKADVAALRGPRFASCVKRILARFVPRVFTGASVRSIVLQPLPVASYGQFSMGYRATITLGSQGQTLVIYDDEVLLGKGRIELSASFSNQERPFDAALRRALAAKLGARLASA